MEERKHESQLPRAIEWGTLMFTIVYSSLSGLLLYLLNFGRYVGYLSQSIDRTKKHLEEINVSFTSRSVQFGGVLNKGWMGKVRFVPFNLQRIAREIVLAYTHGSDQLNFSCPPLPCQAPVPAEETRESKQQG